MGCRRAAIPPAPAPPLRLEVRAEAVAGLNPDPAGNPCSVVVRLYQLRGRTGFARLSFDQAASGRPDQELLGGDCLERTELVLVPGSLRTAAPDLRPETRFIGIVALFRHPHPTAWRCLVDLGPSAPHPQRRPRKGWFRRSPAAPAHPGLAFQVQANALKLTDRQPDALSEPPGGDPGPVGGRP